MWEAFLLQMNDFDSLLELQLRHMLDPVVAQRPPARRGHRLTVQPVVTIPPPTADLVVEAVPVTTPMVAAMPRLPS